MREFVKVQQLGLREYCSVWQQLRRFTTERSADTLDEIWLLEHESVYTQGQAGKPEHLLDPQNIPIIKSDRGGQVTYHGPGQLIVYLLTDIQRKKINIKQFIFNLEQAVIELLESYNIKAHRENNAPGVYVNNAKICSLGLRVRHGRTYHGLSLNIAMDLEPFTRINPCGYTDMQVVQIKDFGVTDSVNTVAAKLLPLLIKKINYQGVTYE